MLTERRRVLYAVSRSIKSFRFLPLSLFTLSIQLSQRTGCQSNPFTRLTSGTRRYFHQYYLLFFLLSRQKMLYYFSSRRRMFLYNVFRKYTKTKSLVRRMSHYSSSTNSILFLWQYIRGSRASFMSSRIRGLFSNLGFI